jgi:ribosomal-protein-alanine N-acetyltransferase
MIISLDNRIFDYPWTFSQWIDEVKNITNKVVILYLDRELLYPFGFMSYSISGDIIELKKIGILPEFRKQKLAYAAMETMLEEARKKNINNVIIEVAITNTPAIKLYEKLGFYKISVRRKYYRNLVDAVVMQKEL